MVLLCFYLLFCGLIIACFAGVVNVCGCCSSLRGDVIMCMTPYFNVQFAPSFFLFLEKEKRSLRGESLRRVTEAKKKKSAHAGDYA